MEKENLSFRFAREEDAGLVLEFIRQLAAYERMEDQVVATEALLREELFQKKHAEVLFALDGAREVGFALFFHNFSTFLGRAGLYLEDLFVLPEERGKGHGARVLGGAVRTLEEITVLEVKYDAFLPDVVRMAVQVPGRQASACSKYALCRRFD